ncbi:ATP-binding protein [Clostridium sartagoforme]|uniref:ATP-binding protein n=1 Tax=Clostridium sartagoforme TaxID=84031 RepID=UPI0031D4B12A
MTCKTCGERQEKLVKLFGKTIKVNIICSCREKELEEKNQRLKIIKKNSLMEKSFYNKTFENWDFEKGDTKLYNLGIKYIDNFKEIKEEGLGLLITGAVGNGKSYLSFAIALLKKGVPVVCISINGLLERIKETYSTLGKEGEWEIIKLLGNADLLVIDDLVTEQNTEWSISKIYTIIDSRYRNKLPTVVTTNYPVGILKDRYGERTVDRLIEMSTIVESKGISIRKINALENKENLKRFLSSKITESYRYL